MKKRDEEYTESFEAYEVSRRQADSQIDSLLPQYGIVLSDETASPLVLIGEQIMRSHLRRLIDAQQEGATEEDLTKMKQAIAIEVIAHEYTTIDSPWIDLIEGITPTAATIRIDEDFMDAVDESRVEIMRGQQALARYMDFMNKHKLRQTDEDSPLSFEEATAFLDSLSPDERAEFDALQRDL